MFKKHKKIILLIIFIVYSVALFNIASQPTNIISNKTNDPQLARFIENYNVLKENWYFFKSEKEVINAATEAMVESNKKNDVYTYYIPEELSEEYLSSMESDFVGIGVTYTQTGYYPLITRVLYDSPAQKAELKAGDFIKEIDNQDLADKEADEVKKLILGKVNDTRNLTIIRNKQEQKIEVKLANIESSVESNIIKGKGYLSINNFSKTTAQEVEEELEVFKDKKIKQIIIDLRGNPGGYLDTLEDIADLFLKANKVILKTKDAQGHINEYKSTSNQTYDFDVILLADNNSASASEALLACLNENLNYPIYGETTYGKGIMQNMFEYDDGAFLKYTNAEWLTPKGNSINKSGIKPTNKVKKSKIYQASSLAYVMDKDIKFDSVNKNLIEYQKALLSLGYDVDRQDGYYSSQTAKAINKFKKNNNLEDEKDLSKKVQAYIMSQVFSKIATSKDLVLEEALK